LAKAQQAIDGKQGKDWKITSLMGNRIHPVTKEPKHHNGTDIWAPAEPCWIEAPYDGVVTEAKKSTAAGGGFGNFVMISHKINGEHYTTVFAHIHDGSIKVWNAQWSNCTHTFESKIGHKGTVTRLQFHQNGRGL
jgi:murein DD-endopeptidase MepM/ murein hydrolase activator NlpD